MDFCREYLSCFAFLIFFFCRLILENVVIIEDFFARIVEQLIASETVQLGNRTPLFLMSGLAALRAPQSLHIPHELLNLIAPCLSSCHTSNPSLVRNLIKYIIK